MTLRSNAVTALGLAGGVWVVLSARFRHRRAHQIFPRAASAIPSTGWRALPRAAFGAALGHIGFGVMVIWASPASQDLLENFEGLLNIVNLLVIIKCFRSSTYLSCLNLFIIRKHILTCKWYFNFYLRT